MQPAEFMWIYGTTCVMIVLIELFQVIGNLLKKSDSKDKQNR